MRIAFRTDASLDIGTGHVMRCLTLADALRDRGANCHFLCRAHSGHLSERISAAGHQLTLIPPSDTTDDSATLTRYSAWLGGSWQDDAMATGQVLAEMSTDWLVVDHYALDARWESAVRPSTGYLMVIDDLADRPHDCDLLLDQNLGRDPDNYAGRVPAHAQLLLGTNYALLRPEFAALRDYSLSRDRDSGIRRIFVTMGGIDLDNATGRVLDALALCQLPANCRIMVAMGRHSPWLENVDRLARDLPFPCEVRIDATDIARIMADSDLGIGAVGGTAWERCCLGLPAISIVVAENQRDGAVRLAHEGAISLVRDADALPLELPRLLNEIQREGRLGAMSFAASRLVDGDGVGRVVDAMRGRLS